MRLRRLTFVVTALAIAPSATSPANANETGMAGIAEIAGMYFVAEYLCHNEHFRKVYDDFTSDKDFLAWSKANPDETQRAFKVGMTTFTKEFDQHGPITCQTIPWADGMD
jgi:hypothetical protein